MIKPLFDNVLLKKIEVEKATLIPSIISRFLLFLFKTHDIAAASSPNIIHSVSLFVR